MSKTLSLKCLIMAYGVVAGVPRNYMSKSVGEKGTVWSCMGVDTESHYYKVHLAFLIDYLITIFYSNIAAS